MSFTLNSRKTYAVHHKGNALLILNTVNDERAMVYMSARRLPGSSWFG